MIKRVLGNAPFEISCNDTVLLPGKTREVVISLSNDTEYDLPLSFRFEFNSKVKCDLSAFNIVVPAEGNTQKTLKFEVDQGDKIFTAEHLCNIKVHDGVLESESDYELILPCEMAFKYSNEQNDFSPADEVYFTRDGAFFINKDEFICLEIPLSEQEIITIEKDEAKALVFVDGKVADNREIMLHEGLNKLCIKACCDQKIELFDKYSMQKIYLNTLNPMIFLED